MEIGPFHHTTSNEAKNNFIKETKKKITAHSFANIIRGAKASKYFQKKKKKIYYIPAAG